jgi:hypothetical protein
MSDEFLCAAFHLAHSGWSQLPNLLSAGMAGFAGNAGIVACIALVAALAGMACPLGPRGGAVLADWGDDEGVVEDLPKRRGLALEMGRDNVGRSWAITALMLD